MFLAVPQGSRLFDAGSRNMQTADLPAARATGTTLHSRVIQSRAYSYQAHPRHTHQRQSP